ncbi:hypothetical protein K458DRAFT_381822 [Lentithecium fluviatile CBS 122367]|uniref:Uncharacterized protein n=1 Tax=Lentithecium fluviatile CBS 122367 TaxID=1168545 RepID=A0A6G1JN44_9PLEO|nr:hypothetical protein K458DRAFT_381822 [Lentithecium fluviatile CBS 122367]
MAAPIPALEALRCHCITFSIYSLPAACTLPGAQNLDWSTAQRLASTHNLAIEFASQDTVTRVLQVEQPLPTGVLMSLYPWKDAGGGGGANTKVICGVHDEVQRMILDGPMQRVDARVLEQEAYVSGVLAVLVLGVILWGLGEIIWQRYFRRGGQIKLEGEEKALTVAREQDGTENAQVSEEKEKRGWDCESPALNEDEDFEESAWGP